MFVLVLACLVGGLLYLAPPRPKPSDARIAQLEAQLAIAQRQVSEWRGKSDQAAYRVATRKQALQVADTVIRIGLKRAERVVQDTTISPDTLRQVLAQMVTKVTMYQAEVLRYQEVVDSLLIAHVQERQAVSVQIDTLTALAEARVPTPCSYLGLRCPNRTTAFLLGVGSALVLAVAVAF